MTLNLNFLGAAGVVTGSRTLVELDDRRFLVDCGLFQGDKTLRLRNWQNFPVDPKSIESVILTHAHLDHSGFLPRLVHEGFAGRIYCSDGTADLARILLLDSAHLEEEQAAFANESGYSNHKPARPLFTTADAERALGRLTPTPRFQWITLTDAIKFRFLRAGHIIGASMVQFQIDGPRHPTNLTFTGDLGHNRSQLMRAPDIIENTDVLVIESTYGNRLQPRGDLAAEFEKIANSTLKRGGVLVIPAFAVGRSQDIIYLIAQLERQGRIPKVPVILDSPMSIAATDIFFKHEEDHQAKFAGRVRFFPEKYEISQTPNDSMLACMRDGPMIVISAAGMLSGGRILHHLKHRLPFAENTVLFAGYQAEGTKGRYLQDNGATGGHLRIHHKEIPINAEIATITGLSAHGDYQDLCNWCQKIGHKPERIFINHGTEASGNSLKGHLAKVCPGASINVVLGEGTHRIG